MVSPVRRTLDISRLVFLLAILFVGGCKVDLNTNLSEREANQILAVLLDNDIAASKVFVAEDSVTVQIDERDMLRAINLLEHSGLPKKTGETLGSVFQKTGIMSSPFEERVRFIYALSQELSQTLGEIDGVHTARVHIVLPDDPELGEKVVPSSAAVFIKHREGLDLDFFSPQIKRLVSNAIEGVSYDKVSVVLIEAEKKKNIDSDRPGPAAHTIAGFRVVSGDLGRFDLVFYASVSILVALVASNLVFAAFYFRGRRKSRAAGAVAAPEFEPA